MLQIQYPFHPFKIKQDEEKREYIFDELRKVWIRLTSEEWVRQNFVQYLIQTLKYPPSYVAIERQIKTGERLKRFDLLVFNKAAQPWMMIECKKMERTLDKVVIWQILNYNIGVPVKYLVITNGEQSLGYVKSGTDFKPVEQLPEWE